MITALIIRWRTKSEEVSERGRSKRKKEIRHNHDERAEQLGQLQRAEREWMAKLL